MVRDGRIDAAGSSSSFGLVVASLDIDCGTALELELALEQYKQRRDIPLEHEGHD